MSGAVWHAVWLALPVIAAGLLHVVIIKLDVLPAMASVPLDGGKTFRGKRVFGANKTLRGLFVMTAATSMTVKLLAVVWPPPFMSSPYLVGALLGLGYILGELPNSFAKRQLGVAPGAQARGVWRAVGGVVDQLDSLAGALLVLSLAEPTPAAVWGALVVVTLVVHPLVGALMVALGLKKRVG